MIDRQRIAQGAKPLHLWGVWFVATLVASSPLFVTSIPPLGQHFYNIVRIDILTML